MGLASSLPVIFSRTRRPIVPTTSSSANNATLIPAAPASRQTGLLGMTVTIGQLALENHRSSWRISWP